MSGETLRFCPVILGHYAPALALKAARPSVPLWVLFIGVQVLDIAWAILVLVGIERGRIVEGATASNPLTLDYIPFSHSLVAAIVWAVVSGGVAARALRSRAAGVAVGAAVASHWVADLVVHVPDLPLAAGDGIKLGIGLWQQPVLALAIELALVGAGLALYAKATNGSRLPFLVFATTLVGLTVAGYYAPFPASVEVAAAAGVGLYLSLAALAFFVDRARSRRAA